jgi:hypothetical protein
VPEPRAVAILCLPRHPLVADPIFVFGSNLKGVHGKGAALHAKEKHGARYGVGSGPTGTAYAIPTKSRSSSLMPEPIPI